MYFKHFILACAQGHWHRQAATHITYIEVNEKCESWCTCGKKN